MFFLLKVRLARESLLKKSKNVTKKCMLKKSERCINFFVCRNWYMQIAFLVCVAERCMVFSHYSCTRYRLFCQKWCVAAQHLYFSFFLCSRYRVFQLEKVCRCTEHGVRSLFMSAIHAFLSKMVYRCTASVFFSLSVLAIQVFSLEMVCRCVTSVFFQLLSATAHGFAAEMVCRWRCVGEGVMVRRIKDKWWMVNDAGRRMMNYGWLECIELYGWGWKKGLETRG